MPKVRKPYNRQKQLKRVADHLVKGVLVGYTTGLRGCILIDHKQQRLIPPESREGQQIVAAIKYHPHVWTCTVAAFGINQLGEKYMKSECIVTTERYYQHELAPSFEENHARVIKSVPEHHRVAVGWIASPKGVELSEKESGELFDAMNAWNETREVSAA